MFQKARKLTSCDLSITCIINIHGHGCSAAIRDSWQGAPQSQIGGIPHTTWCPGHLQLRLPPCSAGLAQTRPAAST